MRLGLSAHVSPRPQIDLPVRAQSLAELVLSHFRTAGISALAVALLSCVAARAGDKWFRSQASLGKAVREAEGVRQYDVPSEILDREAIAAREPNLSGDFAGAVFWPTPGFIADPGALAKAYAALFVRKGGRFVVGDARTLTQESGGWRVNGASAREVVVALGPWSDLVFRPLGYSIPLGVKRGYHLHLKAGGNAVLNHPVLDSDLGYLLAPMNRGIRLTTGVEVARRD